MSITLVEVSGIPHALAALKQSKRHYDLDEHLEDIRFYREVSDERGFILPENNLCADAAAKVVSDLTRLAKWGAGVDQGDAGTRIDAGHETLLRYIDFTFAVRNIGYATMADLDSHAKRFDNRIVRSSSRLASYDETETCWWYNDKNLELGQAAELLGIEYPDTFEYNNITWKRTANGYVPLGYENDKDIVRGNYPLHIPMSAVMRINFVDLRHIYMRRNIFTHATPELKVDIEDLADQIEQAIPYDLGKLIRYDYAYDPVTKTNRLAHIMSIRKVIDESRLNLSSGD